MKVIHTGISTIQVEFGLEQNTNQITNQTVVLFANFRLARKK